MGWIVIHDRQGVFERAGVSTDTDNYTDSYTVTDTDSDTNNDTGTDYTDSDADTDDNDTDSDTDTGSDTNVDTARLIMIPIAILVPILILIAIVILKLALMYVSHKSSNNADVHTDDQDGDRILFRNTSNAPHLHCPHPHQ
jgi:hypothetical protein